MEMLNYSYARKICNSFVDYPPLFFLLTEIEMDEKYGAPENVIDYDVSLELAIALSKEERHGAVGPDGQYVSYARIDMNDDRSEELSLENDLSELQGQGAAGGDERYDAGKFFPKSYMDHGGSKLSEEERFQIAIALSEDEKGGAACADESLERQCSRTMSQTEIESTCADTKWHYSRPLHEKLLDFHSKTTRFPKDAIKEANADLHRHLDILNTELRKRDFCSRIEFTGSAYEGVKVQSTELEFDVMVIITNGKDLKPECIKDRAGYYMLRSDQGEKSPMSPYMDLQGPRSPKDRGYIMPHKVVQKLHSVLNKILRGPKFKKDVMQCKLHGPALQLDFKKPGKDKLWYSVDVVPSIEIPSSGTGKNRFVAKPFKSDLETEQDIIPKAWRKSYSLEEKELLMNIDRGNGCRKQCLRILKSIRDREASLNYLHSYVLKTVIFRNVQKGSVFWNQDNLGICVMSMLRKLCEALENKQLPHYFQSDINLLSDFPPKSLKNSAARIRQFLRNERCFYEVIASA